MSTVVILAAGLGSRFGGNKQLSEFGHRQLTLMEYNLINAEQAGFNQAIFIIRPELENLFKNQVLPRISKRFTCHLVHQTFDNLPEHCQINEKRTKPLGTAHALWCCHKLIKSRFAVINADDYYGAQAFTLLQENADKKPEHHFMVAYHLAQTLSDFGGVNRGLCQLNNDNTLKYIEECENITNKNASIVGEKGNKKQVITLASKTLISMNCWFFTPDIFDVLAQEITHLLTKKDIESTLNHECYLPDAVMKQIQQDSKRITVLTSTEQWFGLTFPEDSHLVSEKIAAIFG